jgi:hypothetical protein
MKKGWLRGGLLLVASSALAVGLWALLVPRSFYDDFPLPGREWVSTLGPYNEHLVRDVGALNLALGVLLLFAAVLLERRLVRASLIAWLFYAVPHFAFHLTTLDVFSLFDDLANMAGLGLAVLLPLLILAGAQGLPWGPVDERRKAGANDRKRGSEE